MAKRKKRDDGAPPPDADALHEWLRVHLEVEVPRKAVVEGHTAPFEYVCHAFFEGNDWGGTFPGPARGLKGPAPQAGGTPAPQDCVVWASRGGGKTFLGAVATALELLFKPGITIRILGGSLEQSARMHEHLRRLLERPRLAAEVEGRITERRVRLRNGSSVELLAQSQTSVRGTRVQRLRCDEVELFDPDVWEAAQLVTRSKSCGGVRVRASIECLSTMHVPGGLMSRLVKECGDGKRRLFKWGLVDVLERCGDEHRCLGVDGGADCALHPECGGKAKEPGHSGHLAVDDAVRMKGRVSLATWSSEMLCQRPSRRDAVFPEFEPAAHVVDGEAWGEEGLTWLGGMDFGFRAPTVVLWAALDAGGVLWVVDERHVAGAVLAEHVEAIVKSPWPKFAWIGVDPAGNAASDQSGESAVSVLKKAGLAVRSRGMKIPAGLELIRARLRAASGGPPRLFVHRRCVKLIESLERYRYSKDPESEVPEKDGADHAVDALRYLVTNLDSPYKTEVRGY